MEYGNITIEENKAGQWRVEAQLAGGTLWLTKHQMAQLFGVYVNTIGNNLRAIFKAGILDERKVTRSEMNSNGLRITYNLEALIFVSFRIGSYQARAFREWVMNALIEHTRTDQHKKPGVMIVYTMKDSDSGIIAN